MLRSCASASMDLVSSRIPRPLLGKASIVLGSTAEHGSRMHGGCFDVYVNSDLA